MKLKKIVMGAVAGVGLALPAMAEVTIPDAGVNVGDYITAAITALGGVVAVAVGGYFAFLGIRAAIRWARTALR